MTDQSQPDQQLDQQITDLERHIDELRQESRKTRCRRKWVAGGLIAAVFALNVAPVAANHLRVRSSDIVDGEVRTRDIHTAAVGPAKLGDRAVSSAKIRPRSVNQTKLAPGTIAARGWARVSYDGTVTAGRNVTTGNVAHPTPGYFCFDDLSFQPTAMVATGAGHPPAVTTTVNGWGPCAGQAQVTTYNSADGVETDYSFTVVFF